MPRNARSDARRSRADKRGLASFLPRAFPEALRAKLAPELDSYAAEVLWDLKNRTIDTGGRELATNSAHRTAVDIIPRIMRAVGNDDAIERLLEQFNLRDMVQLALAAQMFHSASGATVDDAERAAVATIQTLVKAHPDRRARLMEACFGLREAGEPQELEGRNGSS